MKFKYAMIVAALVTMLIGSVYAESKVSANVATTASTEGVLIFDPASAGWSVTSYDVDCDKAGSLLKFYGKATIADAHTVKTASNGTQTNLVLTDVTGLAISDVVVVTGDGVTTFRKTVTGVSTSYGIAFATAPGVVPVGAKVYKITELYRIPIGSNVTTRTKNDMVRTIGDSPLVVSLDSVSNITVSVTACPSNKQ